MDNKFTARTALILGEDGINKLRNSHVLVIGVGGVGSFSKSRYFKYNYSRLCTSRSNGYK